MPWLYLLLAALLYVVNVVVSYSPTTKASPYYLPLGLVFGSATGFLWFVSVRSIRDATAVYTYGLWWDAIMHLSFWVLPLVFFSVRLNAQTAFGAALVMAGLFLLQARG